MEVSVILPVYNAAPYLDRAIRSALDEPQVVELIAIDDASTDGSAGILEAWAQKSRRLIYLPAISDAPQRAAAARNRGLAVATAPFIAFLDADDYYLPGRFRRTENYFEAHPETDGLVQPVEVRFESQSGDTTQKYLRNSCRLENGGWSKLSYNDLIRPALQMNGLTIRRSVIEKVPGFDPKLKQQQDQDFSRRMLYTKNNIHIAGCKMSPVAVYYHHSTNTTRRLEEKWKLSAEVEKKWLQLLQREPNTQAHRRRLFYRYVIFKYQAPLWPRWKKATVYPFIFSWEFLRMARHLL